MQCRCSFLLNIDTQFSEAVSRRCSVKKKFLKNHKIQKNTLVLESL